MPCFLAYGRLTDHPPSPSREMRIRPNPTTTAVGIGGEALFANPLRTLLSTLGVIIGVASLVAVLSLGDGMQAAARSQAERLTGVQTVLLTPKTTEQVDGVWIPVRNYPVFTPTDANEALVATGATGMSLVVGTAMTIESPFSNRRRAATVSGALSRADEFHSLELAEGRFFTDAEAERAAAVVVLGHKLATELAPDGDAGRMLGREVRMDGATLNVIGTLAAYEGETGSVAYVPFATAGKVFPAVAAPRPNTLMLRASSIETVEALRSAAEDWAARRFGARLKKVAIETNKMRLAQTEQGILIFKIFMGAIAGISLLVGGVGIMNVLLASVTERTREIGVRKALGARGRDVLLQFLAESVAISGAGSAIGVVLGISGAFLVTAIIRSQANAPFFRAGFSWATVLVAVASSVVVGLVFGTYPALRASRMSPIDAIRHE